MARRLEKRQISERHLANPENALRSYAKLKDCAIRRYPTTCDMVNAAASPAMIQIGHGKAEKGAPLLERFNPEQNHGCLPLDRP